jgi:hypothetical protein
MSTNQEPLVKQMATKKDFEYAKAIAYRTYWRTRGNYAREKLEKKGYFDSAFEAALDEGREIRFVSPDGSEQVKFFAKWSKTLEAAKVGDASAATDSEEAQ